ncbi:G-protein coupled receptor Mth-like isoform X2 [Solenopsis invicta]|uniref:G-protein coupled receptor Mth-like isoform X2 n=1 Tax=Solenopsis invicta TaxID=13686 RepID=UPI00193D0D49|nr:G-protein coupled receptor Mth-like isoform X2 [Solenopsis invicta]
MSMMRFALLGLILFLIRASSEWQLTKCCPPGQIYVNNFTNCESIPLFVIEVYVHYWNITREFQGIPQCDESEDLVTTPLVHFESIANLEKPACLETFYDQKEEPVIIIRHCQSNKDLQVKAIDTSFWQLLHIRKCCFDDTIFDSGTKACVTRLNESQSLGAFLLNRSTDTESAMILTQGPPKCEGPIVNYEVNENDISLRNGTYLVKVPEFNNIVKEESVIGDNICIEMMSEFAVKRSLAVRICRKPEFCDKNACIRKCCSENRHLYLNDSHYGCNADPVPNTLGKFYNALADAVSQSKSFTFDTTKVHGVWSHVLQPRIYIPCKKIHLFWDPDEWEERMSSKSNGHTNGRYCFDVVEDKVNNFYRFELLYCDEYIGKQNYIYTSPNWRFAIFIVKCLFLLMTLLVYAYLPNLQNIHGKTVICYVSSLLLSTAFIFSRDLRVKITNEQLGKTSCKALAYIDFFFICSTHFWLNVMCFDIWRTFGTLRENRIINNRKQRKRFLLYCLYAWGIPFLQSILIIVADNTDILPDYLKPSSFDVFECRFAYEPYWDNYGELIFFYGPLMILMISNIVFFILTTKYYNKVKADIKNVITDPRSKQLHSIRKRFIMNVKLFIVMGLTWIFGIVVYFLNKFLGYNHHWEMFAYIHAILYYLDDLLIFIIFVLKKSVYKAICKR